MKEKPILMSAPMVKAILDGRKSMTRRVVKKQPPFDADYCYPSFANEPPVWWDFYQSGNPVVHRIKCPYQLGQVIWVRETWHCDNPATKGLCYRATEAHPEIFPKWKPSIFMPRWASRITLEITDVRVERLQNITEEDAKAEGVSPFPYIPDGDCWTALSSPGQAHKVAFEFLWGQINGWEGEPRARATWQSNPWVWVVSFQRP